MKQSSPDQLLIGAHTSAAGGAHNALLEGKAIGATTIQLFTSNQKRWEGKTITDEEVKLWESALEETGLKQIMSHDSYLINLGSSDKEILEKSRKTFGEEIKRCHKLNIAFLNFHPGAATGETEEKCLNIIVESLLELESLVDQGPTRLLFECTAGQGTSVGYSFGHLGFLVDKLQKKIPIGVCLDTCHLFAAGYDIRTKEGWETTLKEFEERVGLKHLYALHINDSMKPLGSRKDRHAPLGKGEIGLESFQAMMHNPHLRELPKYLETPDGPPLWKEEIHLLREFAKK